MNFNVHMENLGLKGKAHFWLLMALAAALFCGVILRAYVLDFVMINEFVTRDFERAFNIIEGNYIPLAGPELNNGGRLPGPFLYFLLAIPLLIRPSYESIFVFNFILNIASITVVFFIFKKYFNTVIAVVGTSFLAINFISILAVLFPINPSFIFPFIALYLGSLLELVLNRNQKAALPLVLSLCLAVQIHYSMATFILAPIVLALTYRIRISPKIIVTCLLAGALCFMPYLIYKYQFFIPTNDGDQATLGIESITLKNTLSAISLIPIIDYLKGPGYEHLIYLFPHRFGFSHISVISFYILMILAIFKCRRSGWQSIQKELATLSFFYIPSFIYGLTHPKLTHFWYMNIFIIPQSLLIAHCIYSTYEILTGIQGQHAKYLGKIFTVLTVSYFLISTFFVAKHTYKTGRIVKPNLRGNLLAGAYKPSQLMLETLMSSLDLSADEFYKNVYFLDYHVTSRRRLTAIFRNTEENFEKLTSRDDKPCFFIKKPPGEINRYLTFMDQVWSHRFKLFLSDPTIQILSKQAVVLNEMGVLNRFEVYKYKPVNNQPCYSNNFNPFVVDKKIRDLLIEAKDILKNEGVARIKPVSVVSKYNSNEELESFAGYYVINHRKSQAPFGFNLSIHKSGENYRVRGTIYSYYFYITPNAHPRKIDLVINTKSVDSQGNSVGGLKNRASPVNSITLNILPKRTLVSAYNNNNSIQFSYNQTWYREFDVSLPLHKGQYDIHLSVTTPVEDTMWSSLNFNPNSVEVLNFKLSTHNKRRK